MHDPVVDKEHSSYVYKRAAIEGGLSGGENTSPVTRQPLRLNDLTPNRNLKSTIIDHHLAAQSKTRGLLHGGCVRQRRATAAAVVRDLRVFSEVVGNGWELGRAAASTG